MTHRQAWVRAAGKRPIQVDGTPASSTDPATWSTFGAVAGSSVGDGLGIMLGQGLGCYDLDHALDGDQLVPAAAEILAQIPEPMVFTEVSMSGTGLHVFVLAPEGKGVRRPGFERYTAGRFIRTTGRSFALASSA